MRIISKFRDYYDGLQRRDSELIWKRLSPFIGGPEEPIMGMEDQPVKILNYVPLREELEFWPGLFYRWFLLGFCGKVYFVTEIPRNSYPGPNPTPGELVWSFDDWQKHQVKEIKKKNISRKNLQLIKNFFIQSPLPEVAELFEKYKTPLFFIQPTHHRYPDIQKSSALFINTVNLYGLGWQRRMDAYTTFQEIEMFLGGMAHPEPRITQISDSDQLQKKGFDNRWSFRHRREK